MKTVLVTGASAGIGKATAIELAQNGYNVYGGARRTENMEELKSFGVKPVFLDITKEDSIVHCIDQIKKETGSVEVLVNSAGSGYNGALEDMPIADAKYQMEVNVFGAARLIQLVLPDMRKNKFGKIVNISSVSGKFSLPLGGWYSSSKFALEGLSDSLRNEVKQFGIDVIVVEPGGTKTEIGAIIREYLMRISGKTVYKDLAERMECAMYNPAVVEQYPGPDTVAKLIRKAINANKPETRYVSGSQMKIVLFLKRILSDNLFDKIIISQMK